MSILEVILSGIIQGVTEFLPVSSSGHLVILHKFLGLNEPQIVFDIVLHLGTLTAILIVFRRDIIDVFTIKKRLGVFILLGTAATVLFVLLFGNRIEPLFTNLKAVGVMFIITGLWLILGNILRFGTQGISGVKAILIGLVQGIATIPGISRSGTTISTALFLGFDGRSAARFSFLLAIPAIIGAFLFKIKEAGSFTEIFSINYFLGFIFSCIVGIFSLKFLLKTLYNNKFHLFGIYCILLGIVVLVIV